MKIAKGDSREKIRAEIFERLENSSSRKFTFNMILATVLTYLGALTVLVLLDLILYQAIDGGANFTGLLLYFLSESILMFFPIAIVSSIFIYMMIKPIIKIMQRNERGESIPNAEYFTARKRSTNIPQIIFIANILFPVILHIAEGAFSPVFTEGLVLTARDITIMILAALCQNAIYQSLLSKPRAIMQIHTVDSTSRNWFVRNLDRIQLYTSVIFIAAVLFHSAMTLLESVTSQTMPGSQSGQSTEQEAPAHESGNSLDKMRQTMQNVIDTETDEQSGPGNEMIFPLMFLLLMLISIGLVRIVDTIVTRAKQTQLRILRYALGEMAAGTGDLTKRVLIVQADETGELSHQLNMMLDQFQTMFKTIIDQTNQVAESSKKIGQVLEGTVAATEEMAASVSQINSNTSSNRKILETSQQSLTTMLNSLDQINSNVNTQAAYVEQTSSAMTEMIANIQSVNEMTGKANNVSTALKNVSDTGSQAVLNSISAVKDIEQSSNEVNKLIQIISRILAATNMLAMNAAIEAAHAGDAGRGFAVVAEEVRNLADDSSSNLKTISQNIKDVIDKVERGVTLSENAGEALNEVGDKTSETNRLMSEVAAAMQEQSAGANEVLNSINSLVEASASINKLSDEQHKNNAVMKDNLQQTVNAFIEVQTATSELSVGNNEILRGIDELKDVIAANENIVDSLQKMLGGYKL